MTNVIKQIVNGDSDSQSIKMVVKDKNYNQSIRMIMDDNDSQSIKMIVKDNERGAQGEQGEQGIAATIEVGNVYTTDAGTNAQIMNTGTENAAIFDFYIPKGQKGDSGEDGAIHYTAGTGIQITSGNVINATGAAVATWGGIQGTLSDQTDLKNALDAKQNTLTAGSNISISSDTISATYSNFTGTDGNTDGTSGLVPAPTTTDAGKFLKADGTWDTAGGVIDVFTTNEWNALWA